MEEFKAPPGWTVHVSEPVWRKPHGGFDRHDREIDIYPPKWIPTWFGLRRFFTAVIRNHEVLHAWGSPGCSDPNCLGYEGATYKEYLAMPIQFLFGLRFCVKCLSYYYHYGAKH